MITIWSQELPIFTLSSRFFHPRNQTDNAKTLDAIDELNPKKIDWIYYENDAILEKYKKKGLPFSLTLNPQIADSLGYTSKKNKIIDYKGEIFIAPWMKSWKVKNPYWGCVNNPNFKKLFLDKSLFLASKEPYALMVDDALFNARLKKVKLIGCFCNYCTKKYNLLNRRKTSKSINKADYINVSGKGSFNIEKYESFQEKSVVDFLKTWMNDVKKVYPNMLFYTNNPDGEWNQIYKTFDGGIAEIKEIRINDTDLNRLYRNADILHKSQVFTLDSENRDLQFKLLEYNIKNKRETIFPWDIMIVKENRRFYMPLDTIKKIITELEIKYKNKN
ncbi:hypothetical protein [Flavobacterium sp.]|uniref:hypothetical protein n=1 Tax=Flavobacterium sp. TaxID=239 RepID=UPI00286DDCC7|nr:hypothetical protein [Flavobacterium sp.]